MILTGIGLTFYLYEKFYVEKQIDLLLMQGKQLAFAFHSYGNENEFRERLQWTDQSSEAKVLFTNDPMQLSAGVPYDEYLNDNLITFEERQRLLSGESVVIIRQHPKFNQNILGVTIPLLQGGLLEGAIFIYMPLEDVYEPFEPIRLALLVSLVLILFILIWSGRKITEHLIYPLKKMESVSHQMALGDFSQRIEVKQIDEVGSLSISFNKLAESLEKVEQQRREFLQNVSHELRTPLSYMKGYSEAIVDGIVGDKKSIHKYMSIIHSEVGRMQRLVNDLLDLAQLEGDSYPMKEEPLSFAQLIVDVVERFEIKCKQKQLKIDIDLDYDIIIKGDSDRLEQVISNLLDNAIRHTPDEETIKVSLAQKKTSAVMSIEDSGPGIPEEDISKVTDRFYRVDKARSRADGGTGLGLAIVNQIVKKHQGNLLIYSSEGKGTKATVRIPLFINSFQE